MEMQIFLEFLNSPPRGGNNNRQSQAAPRWILRYPQNYIVFDLYYHSYPYKHLVFMNLLCSFY